MQAGLPRLFVWHIMSGVEFTSVRFTRLARRHRIAAGRARHVIEHPYVVIVQPADAEHPDVRVVLLGDDQRGLGLVVGGPVIDKLLLVIHVEPVAQQSRYRRLYEMGKELARWHPTT